MLSLQTLNTIEALLMSRSHPLWGEFMPLAQIIGEVQQAKAALIQAQSRIQPAPPPPPPAATPPPSPPVPAPVAAAVSAALSSNQAHLLVD